MKMRRMGMVMMSVDDDDDDDDDDDEEEEEEEEEEEDIKNHNGVGFIIAIVSHTKNQYLGGIPIEERRCDFSMWDGSSRWKLMELIAQALKTIFHFPSATAAYLHLIMHPMFCTSPQFCLKRIESSTASVWTARAHSALTEWLPIRSFLTGLSETLSDLHASVRSNSKHRHKE